MPNTHPSEVNRPTSLLDLWQVWLEWMQRLLMENHLPLSGNVEQWIRAWGEAVSQIGLINVNLAGSNDPRLEQAIVKKYSYGSEIGRILDVLTPLVSKARADVIEGVGERKVLAFESMAEEIKTMKEERMKNQTECLGSFKDKENK
jgi:hypothetical protein